VSVSRDFSSFLAQRRSLGCSGSSCMAVSTVLPRVPVPSVHPPAFGRSNRSVLRGWTGWFTFSAAELPEFRVRRTSPASGVQKTV